MHRSPLRPARLLAAATVGTLAVAPLLTPRPVRRATAPAEVPAPPSWPLVAAGLAALGGAVAIRRRVLA